MGTRLDMILHGHSEQEGHVVAEAVLKELSRLERMLSRYRKDSPVWMINHLAGKKSLRVDDELFNILLTCREFHEQTGGLFDISLGSVVDLVRQGDHDPVSFKKLLDSSGMKQLILDPHQKTIRFRKDQVQVDFGGFGKGYALECTRKLLLSHGILNAFISFGESAVLALGNHPHGTGWKAGVNHQMIAGNNLFTFDLQNESLSTSGITSGKVDAAGMGHILHPVRGITETKYHHISIKSSSATEAEMLSTSLMAANEAEREKILTKFHSCQAVGISYDSNGRASIDMLVK
jgi:thiamine biosynthesis lipoprotein